MIVNNEVMETEELEVFTSKVKDFFNLKASDQIDYFIYYLTIQKKLPQITSTSIKNCFNFCNLNPYSNISQYLITNLKGKDKSFPKFIRIKETYQLHRNFKFTLEDNFQNNALKAKASKDLKQLLNHITNSIENEFLKEAIDCFEISAYRAAIVMVWNLTMDHLYEFILKHHLTNFNLALSKNLDKRIKVCSISTKDDFGEIPEGKFIELCRGANIISNDIRKILDNKLGIRNSYAHPSNIKVLESKAVEFIEDLVNNVILKYFV